jgi:hypothetical protein
MRIWVGPDDNIGAAHTPATEDKVKSFMCALCRVTGNRMKAEAYLLELQAIWATRARPWLEGFKP